MGLWSWDAAADIQTRDANLNRLLGLEPVETQGPCREFLDRIHPDDRALVAEALDASAGEGLPVHLDFRVVRPDGAVRWLRHQGGPSGEPDDEASRLSGASLDFTELTETGEAMRRARKHLEERVAARISMRTRHAHSRAFNSARELCDLAERLAKRASDAADLATTPKTLRAAIRLAASTVQVAERALRLSRNYDLLKLEAVERDWIESVWTEVRRAIVNGEEEQRRRISRELHDQMGQHCASLIIGLTALEASLPQGSEARAPLDRLVPLAHRIDDDLHRIARELRPSALDDFGLHDTLLNFAEEWGERANVVVDFRSQGLEHRRLPPEVETAAFRIAQEALTNIQKHARADRVGLILRLRGDELLVIIEDDGKGLDPGKVAEAEAAGRMGMPGMRERAALIGGSLEVESTPDAGTTIFVRIPLRPATEATTDG